ncbi:hypothetical protein SAY87_028204 [Trapa incisa]|uniref:Uncharacterized protein n=1 Tax=Trapa incisa TaxID=236973 RepID=A0AAN7L0R1_9MYRT|nr:hypothetical protein SAY87_028204 [Trapa incisa]
MLPNVISLWDSCRDVLCLLGDLAADDPVRGQGRPGDQREEDSGGDSGLHQPETPEESAITMKHICCKSCTRCRSRWAGSTTSRIPASPMTERSTALVLRWHGTEAASHGQSTIKHIHLGFQIMLQRAAQMRNCKLHSIAIIGRET